MTKCKIVIEGVEVPDERYLGLMVKMDVREPSMADKFMIMHTLANSLELNKADLMRYILSEQAGVYEGNIISMPLMEEL